MSHQVSPSRASDARAADRFLAGYVTGDGRVIRRDQGGDIVSEGQAYGMLIAEVVIPYAHEAVRKNVTT